MNVTQVTVSLAGLAAITTTAVQVLAQTLPVPSDLQVPANQRLLISVAAQGEQIYNCQAKTDSPTEFAWTLKAPAAKLFDPQGQQIGQHYGGPSWELNDGSKIVGQLKTKVDAPQTDAIPWLLLQVKSHEGEGKLSRVNWIQRVNTVGGKSPQTGCDSVHQNQEIQVNYSADYYFYGE